MKKIYAIALVLFGLSLLLSGCAEISSSATATPPPSPTATNEPPKRIPTSKWRASRTPTRTPTQSLTPTETSTPTVTQTPTVTITATPTATLSPTITVTVTLTRTATITSTPPDPNAPTPHPMSIVAMRQGTYAGSDIVVDEELTPGSNYRRYYVYYRSQKLRIYALLTIPNGEMPYGGWPGIVFNHGYIPPAEYRTTEKYIAYVDQLASNGYAVFRIDYRGHGHSDGDPQGAYGDPGYEVDVLNAIASLKRHPQVNPNLIGMWGHSMGGYLTLRSMVLSHDVKAGVIWAGVVAPYADILYNWPSGPQIPPENSRKWMDEWPDEYGTPDDNPLFWDSISANSYLADLSGPIQLHYGTSDETVPPQFSETLAIGIRKANRSVEIYAYPNDNHNISNYFDLAMERTVAFFDSILK